MSSDSDSESENDYEVCNACPRSSSFSLPFDPAKLESIILTICDRFELRVIMSDSRIKSACVITTGLSFAGGLIGKHYGGKIGAAVGGAIGGVCGLGFVAVSMRDLWKDVKAKLWDLLDLVYDFLGGLGIEDYKRAASFLTSHSGESQQLAMVIMETASTILGKQILSKMLTE